MMRATNTALESRGANETSATNVSTPATPSMSSLHKTAALGVERKNHIPKMLTQLITILILITRIELHLL